MSVASKEPSSQSMFEPSPWTTFSGPPDERYVFVPPPVIITLPTVLSRNHRTTGGNTTDQRTDPRTTEENSTDHMATGRNSTDHMATSRNSTDHMAIGGNSTDHRTTDRKRNRFLRYFCFSSNGPRQHAD